MRCYFSGRLECMWVIVIKIVHSIWFCEYSSTLWMWGWQSIVLLIDPLGIQLTDLIPNLYHLFNKNFLFGTLQRKLEYIGVLWKNNFYGHLSILHWKIRPWTFLTGHSKLFLIWYNKLILVRELILELRLPNCFPISKYPAGISSQLMFRKL